MPNKIIPIKCGQGLRTVSYRSLKPFQGSLKEMSQDSAKKLRASILKYGWRFPIFVWRDGETEYVHDGHGRLLVLKALIAEGYMIDKIPVVDIQADDRRMAAALLLALNSKHGVVTGEGLYGFVHDFDIDPMELEAFDIPDIDLDDFRAELFEHDDMSGEETGPLESNSKACQNCGYEG